MTTELSRRLALAANRCPVTGRSATACEDPTHAGCVAGHVASIALDRVVEQGLAEQEERAHRFHTDNVTR